MHTIIRSLARMLESTDARTSRLSREHAARKAQRPAVQAQATRAERHPYPFHAI